MKEYKRWNDVPENLKSKSYCTKERLNIKQALPVAKVYQRANNLWIDLYDINTLDKKPPLTEAQLLSQEKAKATREARYTCKVCGDYNTRTVNKETKLCRECSNWHERKLQEIEIANMALQSRLSWSDEKHIDQYVILDTETTGLYGDDEVVEIAIMDLKGNTLYNSLIKPTKAIPNDAIRIHGITNEEVSTYPTIAQEIDKLDAILNGKCILAYNAEFDSSMINHSLSKHGIKRNYNWTCVMYNEMEICQTDRFISLAHACSIEKWQQGHRALSDCQLVYQLITDRNWIKKELDDNYTKIEDIKRMLSTQEV